MEALYFPVQILDIIDFTPGYGGCIHLHPDRLQQLGGLLLRRSLTAGQQQDSRQS